MTSSQPSQHDIEHELHHLRQLHCWRDELERFTAAVHRSLDPTDTAYCIANDGRKLIGCDRLTVVLRHHRTLRLEAISGQDIVQRRANAVRLLERFAGYTLAMGEPLWYPEQTNDLAPPVHAALQAYIAESHVKSLLLLPLFAPDRDPNPTDEKQDRGDPFGGLVVEQFSGPLSGQETWQRLEAVGQQSATALHNTLEHERIFLLPLWKALGRWSWIVKARTLPKTLFFAICLLVAMILLCVVPMKFTLVLHGTVQPELRRNVFARTDGVVTELFVKEGATVAASAILAELRNTELDLQVEQVVGELQTVSKKLAALKASRLVRAARNQRAEVDASQLAAQEEESREWLSSLQQQHALLMEQKAYLKVRSPIRGEVITWSVDETLAARPISRGQLLLTVADLDGPWVLELLLPDRRIGHLLAAQQEFGSDLQVSFILATDPSTRFAGRIQQVAKSTQLDEQHGQCVLVTAGFRKEGLDFLRPGAVVTAKIHCGRRAAGYVLFHDLFEFIQTRIMFRW